MLSLKVLKGMPLESFTLKEGANIIGRSATCDIVLNSTSVSKKHAQIMVRDGQCSISDIGSSNGTYVNGMRIKDRILKNGDRIGFHDIILELIQVRNMGAIPSAPSASMSPVSNHSLAFNLDKQNHAADLPQQITPKTLSETALFYVENVVLPGIYKINETTPTKTIIAGLVFIFAVVVTMLATIPMSSLMKESIQKEAQRRALTVARQLAAVASQSMAAGNEGAIRTDIAENEDGVIAALVVAKEDGHIIAPLSKAQSYSNEEFVARARRSEESFIDQVNDKTVGASVPIKLYSADSGQQLIAAYAVIIYKMNTLDLGASTGLFARVLMIALLLGFVVYFFIYRLTREPAKHALGQLDRALRGEINFIEPKYNDETFSKLISNVNSAISRMGSPQQSLKMDYDRTLEATNLTRILNDSAISINSQGLIICVNSHFEDLTGQRLLTLQNQNLEVLQDQALKLNLEDLRQKLISAPSQIASNQLEIGGVDFDIDGQAVSDGEKVFYVLITIKKRGIA